MELERKIKLVYRDSSQSNGKTNSSSSVFGNQMMNTDTYAGSLKRAKNTSTQNDANGFQKVANSKKRANKADKMEYRSGDKVKYYDIIEDGLRDAVIIQRSGPSSYQLGSNGKKFHLNVKDIIRIE